MNLGLMVFIQKINYLEQKLEHMSQNLNGKKIKEQFHTALYFDSFEIKYIPRGVLNIMMDKFISHNIFRIQSDDSVMCGLYCTGLYMIDKNMLDYINLLSPNDYQKNDKITYKFFKDKNDKRKRRILL